MSAESQPTQKVMPRHAAEVASLLAGLARPALRGAEVGVFRGETSEALLRCYPSLTLYMVDSWAVHRRGGSYRKSGDQCARLSLEAQDANAREAALRTEFAAERRALLRMESVAAAAQIEEGSLDFVFLDADHTYQAVASDLVAWWPNVRRGGLLCGHDYGHPRDRRGVWGVARAVDEFLESLGLKASVTQHTIWWAHKT